MSKPLLSMQFFGMLFMRHCAPTELTHSAVPSGRGAWLLTESGAGLRCPSKCLLTCHFFGLSPPRPLRAPPPLPFHSVPGQVTDRLAIGFVFSTYHVQGAHRRRGLMLGVFAFSMYHVQRAHRCRGLVLGVFVFSTYHVQGLHRCRGLTLASLLFNVCPASS